MTDRPEDPSNSKEIDPDVPAAPEPEPEAVTDAELDREPADADASDEFDEADAEDEAVEADDDAEATDEATEAVPGAATPTGGRRRGAAPVKPRAPTLSEIAVHVNEPWSKIFVIAAIAVFVAIMLNGLLLGKGGLLTGTPTSQPSASAIASPSGSASPATSASPVASPSPVPSASPAASATASAVSSASTSAAPSVSPSP